MKLLLASNSPRRKELLTSLGYEFDIIKIEIDESYPETIETEKIAEYISSKKAKSHSVNPNEIIITADTIVALENQILQKPKNEIEAFEMLKQLSNKTHQVYTAFTIKTDKEQTSKTSKTDVTFSELSDDEINYYIKQYKPFDKAGSYGIQEWIGMAKIKSINGSFYSVMGLPVDLLYEELKKTGLFPNNY